MAKPSPLVQKFVLNFIKLRKLEIYNKHIILWDFPTAPDVNSDCLWVLLYITKYKLIYSSHRKCDPWTVAHQAPTTMGFSRQEYWSEQAFLSPGNLPDPRIKTLSPASPALAGRFFTVWATRETQYILLIENAVNTRIERTKFVTASPLKATIVSTYF